MPEVTIRKCSYKIAGYLQGVEIIISEEGKKIIKKRINRKLRDAALTGGQPYIKSDFASFEAKRSSKRRSLSLACH